MGVTGEWPRWKLKPAEDKMAWGGEIPQTGPAPPDRCGYCGCKEGCHSHYCPFLLKPFSPRDDATIRCPRCDQLGGYHSNGCAYALGKVSSAALPTDYDARKALPLYDFMFSYFPLAWLEVVKVAVAGNNQHNPGEKLHWAREKSTDQLNTAFRHLFDHGMGTPLDTDGCYHLAKAIWRLSAELQLLVEKSKAQP